MNIPFQFCLQCSYSRISVRIWGIKITLLLLRMIKSEILNTSVFVVVVICCYETYTFSVHREMAVSSVLKYQIINGQWYLQTSIDIQFVFWDLQAFYASIFISNVGVSFSLISIVECPMESKVLTPVRNRHQHYSCYIFQVNNSFLFSQNRPAEPCHNARAI